MKRLRLHHVSNYLITRRHNFRLVSRNLLLIMNLLQRPIVNTRRLMTLRVSRHRLRLNLTFTLLHTNLVRTNTSQTVIRNNRRITNFCPLTFLSRRSNRSTISLQTGSCTIRQWRQTSTTSVAQCVTLHSTSRARQRHYQHNRFTHHQPRRDPNPDNSGRSRNASGRRHNFFTKRRFGHQNQ